MSEKIKNYLGLAVILGILLLATAAVGFVSSYSKSIDPAKLRSFVVTAEGKAVAVPDVATFSFSVITEGGKNLGNLQKENTEKINKIIDFVKAQGVDSKDIKTINYSVEPRYEYFSCPPVLQTFPEREVKPCPPPAISGYVINQTVSVKVRDFNKIGDLLAGAVEKGANQVSQLVFTVDDRTAVENQAREEAIQKARTKAQGLARAGGFRLGKLLSIDEGFYPIPYYDQFGRGGAQLAEKAAPAPPIEPGSQEVIINMTLRYEIQ